LFTDQLSDDAEDPAWIALCAKNGWVPLTGDLDLLWTPLWRRAIHRARLGVFCLTRNHWRFEEKLAAFIKAMPAIERVLRTVQPPFLARINKGGDIVGVYDFARERDEDSQKDKR
jgi:hypothetical protein